MAEIEWTDEARSWLQQIYDYIARDHEDVASKVVVAIYERAQVLLKFPESGHRYDKYPEKHTRILLYRQILGVFHGSLQIDQYLEVVV